MAFNVVHSPPYLDLALVGQAIGGGELAKEQEKFWLQKNQVQFQQEQALRDFSERRRQFNVNESMQQQRMAMEQDRYDQQFAAEDARAQAMMANQEANRQNQLLSQQMGYDQQAAMAGLQWEQQGADALDTQVKDFFKGARNMQLDPEGQRVLGEFVGKYRDIQANRGTMRPAQYQEVLGRLMGDMEEAGIDSFEIKQPTPWEEMVRTHTPMSGQIMPTEPGQPLEEGWYNVQTGMRNGEATYEKRFVVDPRKGQFREGPNGAIGQINAETGLWEPVEQEDLQTAQMKAENEMKIATIKAENDARLAREKTMVELESAIRKQALEQWAKLQTAPADYMDAAPYVPPDISGFLAAAEAQIAQMKISMGQGQHPHVEQDTSQGFVAQPSMEQPWYQGGHAMNQGAQSPPQQAQPPVPPQSAPPAQPQTPPAQEALPPPPPGLAYPEVSSPEEAEGTSSFTWNGKRYYMLPDGSWNIAP
jgi:hypothetical protein